MNALWVPVQLFFFIGLLLVLIGLPGLYLGQAGQVGWLGLIGFILTFLAGLILGVGGTISGFVLPWLATNAPKLATGQGASALSVLCIVTNLVDNVGIVLLGLATMRAGVLPGWVGGVHRWWSGQCHRCRTIPASHEHDYWQYRCCLDRIRALGSERGGTLTNCPVSIRNRYASEA